MSSKKQIEKADVVINEIINNYFVVDQKLALLKPLLEDKELIPTWDNTPGVIAIEALRLTIYMAILSDMRALLFDAQDSSASIENILMAFNNVAFSKAVKKKFSKPLNVIVAGHDDDPEKQAWITKQLQDNHTAEAEKRFDELLQKTIDQFNELKNSSLYKRVNKARNKMISHKVIRTIDGERGLYNPTDFGLKWGDANDIVEKGKEIIFNANLLITNSSFELDSFLGSHKEAAESFWSVAKNA